VIGVGVGGIVVMVSVGLRAQVQRATREESVVCVESTGTESNT
jgi:hypothetical protein